MFLYLPRPIFKPFKQKKEFRRPPPRRQIPLRTNRMPSRTYLPKRERNRIYGTASPYFRVPFSGRFLYYIYLYCFKNNVKCRIQPISAAKRKNILTIFRPKAVRVCNFKRPVRRHAFPKNILKNTDSNGYLHALYAARL